MTDRNLIGQRITELRRAKGLTQAELADKIGVSHQAVSQWERNETLPDILTIPTLAEIFGESVAVVMGVGEIRGKGGPEFEIETGPIGEVSETNIQSAGACDFSIPITGDQLNINEDEYEIVILKNGKAVKSFLQHPNQFAHITVNGSLGSLKSNIDVTVNGNVNGSVSAGLGLRCGNVGGNASAGMNVYCGDVGGDVNAGDDVSVGGDVDGNVNVGGSITIDGDLNGDIDSCGGDVTIEGDLNGDVCCEGNLTVEGDLNGDAK